MNRVSPRLLDWWIAYYRIEPFGSEWDQTAGITVQLARIARQLAASAGVDVSELDPIRYADHLPPDIAPLPEHIDGPRRMSIEEEQEVFKRRSGT